MKLANQRPRVSLVSTLRNNNKIKKLHRKYKDSLTSVTQLSPWTFYLTGCLVLVVLYLAVLAISQLWLNSGYTEQYDGGAVINPILYLDRDDPLEASIMNIDPNRYILQVVLHTFTFFWLYCF